ncbi:MAG: hypothetical protein Fur0037_21000 [Planctomycetota bacterium]
MGPRGGVLCLWILSAACAAPPAPPTAAESAAAVRDALCRGHVDRAEALLQGAVERDPEDPALLAWSAAIHAMQWRDDLAAMEARRLLRGGRAADLGDLDGFLGDLLFAAGRYAESQAHLVAGARGRDRERRMALASLVVRLPARRRVAGPIATERHMEGGIVEIECSVGDRIRPFGIDTGTSMTTVTRSLARELGCAEGIPAGFAVDAEGREIEVAATVLDPFSVGELDLGATPALVVEDDAFSLRDEHGGAPRPMGGLLGLDVISLFRVTIDPARESVVLEMPRGLSLGDSVACLRSEGRCLVPVSIEGRDLWFVLDTGSNKSSLTESGLAELPGGAGRASPGFHRVRSAGRTGLAVREVRDLVLRVSGVRFRGVDLPVVARESRGLVPVHGVLGLDLLLSCRVILDGGRVRLDAPRN